MPKKKRPARSTTTTPPSASHRIERQAVESALEKLRQGQRPSATERAALKRFEGAQEADRRRLYYRTVPKSHYQELSGRSARVLIDQAKRYGFPYPGAEEGPRAAVNLYAVLAWWHDLLAEHGHKLRGEGRGARGEGRGARGEGDDPLMAGVSSPALERYREERAKLARMERIQREGNLLPRESIHECLTRIVTIVRSTGELLAKQFGDKARQILDEGLDDCAREIEAAFGPQPQV